MILWYTAIWFCQRTRKEVSGREIHLTTSRPLQFFVEVWIFAAHWFTGEYSIVQTSFSVLQLPQLNRSLLATWLNLLTNYPPATILWYTAIWFCQRTRKEVSGREIHLTTSRPLQFFVEVWIFAAHWFTGEYSIVQTSFSVLQLPQLNRSLLATWLNLLTNYPPATILWYTAIWFCQRTRKEVSGREIHLTTSRPLQFFVEVWIFAAHWFTGEYSIVQTSFSVLQLPQLNRSLLATWLNLLTNYPPATFFFSHFHSVSYLCAHALAWSEVFYFLYFIYCILCLEQSPLQC